MSEQIHLTDIYETFLESKYLARNQKTIIDKILMTDKQMEIRDDSKRKFNFQKMKFKTFEM